MADAFGEYGKEDSGSSARPVHTIEGEAVEITPEPERASAEEAAAALQGEGRPSSTGASNDLPREETAAPSRRGASIVELKSFVTHLTAGFVGALIAIGILAFAWNRLPEQSPQSGAASADPHAMAALDKRVKALEDRGAEPSSAISGLNDRVARLEESLKSLGEAAQNGGSVADAAAIDTRVAALEQKLQSQIGAARSTNNNELSSLKNEIGELEAKVAALRQSSQEAGNADEGIEVSGLTDRITKLEASLPKLADALKAETAESQSAAASLALTNLKAAIAAGRPYATELASLKAAAPSVADFGALRNFADSGIPALPELMASFRKLKDESLSHATEDADRSLLGGLMASAKTLVKVRRVDANATDDDNESILARAEAKLDADNLAGGAAEVEKLNGAPRQAFSAWLEQAHARVSADTTLQRIAAVLVNNEPGKGQPQP